MNSFLRGSRLTDFLLFHLKFIGNLIKSISSTFSSISIRILYPSPGIPHIPSPGSLKCFPTLSCVKPLDKQFFANFPPPYPHPSTFNLMRNKKLETRVHIYQWYKKTKLFSFADIHRICYKLEKRCIWGLDEQENEWLEIVELLPCYTMFCNYTYLQYIYLTCLFVCLYPIIVKTDVPSMPVFCGNSHVMAPGKVYVHHQWTKVPGKNVDI